MSIQEKVQGYIDKALGRIKSIADNATGGDWNSLFSSLAGVFVMAWAEFEREKSNEIEPLLHEVESGMTGFEAAAQDQFNTGETAARIELRKAFDGAHLADRQDKTRRQREAEELEVALPKLDKEVRAAKVAMSGTENAVVDIPKHSLVRRIVEVVVFVLGMLGVGEVEALIGFAIWNFSFNSNIALGATIVTVVVPTALAAASAVYQARFIAWKQAMAAFKAKWPNGHPDGFEVDPFPMIQQHLAVWGVRFLMGIAFLLLGSRVWLVVRDGQGQAGLIGAAVIVIILGAVYWAHLALSLAYRKPQYERLAKALSSHDDVKDRITALQVPPTISVYRTAADAAIDIYKKAIEGIKDAIQTRSDELDGKRTQLIELLQQCETAWDMFKHGYRDGLNRLINAVFADHTNLFGQTHPIGNAADDRRTMELFSNRAERKYCRPEFVARLQRFEFAARYDDAQALTEFNELEADSGSKFVVPQIGIVNDDATNVVTN